MQSAFKLVSRKFKINLEAIKTLQMANNTTSYILQNRLIRCFYYALLSSALSIVREFRVT